MHYSIVIRYYIKFVTMKKLLLVALSVMVIMPVIANTKKTRMRGKARVETSASAPEAKFVRSSARIKGTIVNYNSSFPFKTGDMTLNNPFTSEAIPQAFMIADDGTFEIEFPVWFASMVSIKMGGLPFTFYVEPDKTLEVTLIKGKPQITDELAQENIEIAAFERDDVAWTQRIESYKNGDWKDTESLFRGAMEENLHRLDEALAAGTVSDKIYRYLRNVELVKFVDGMLYRQMYMDEERPPIEFYAFMRDIPFDDPGFATIAAIYSLPNLIANMRPMVFAWASTFSTLLLKDDRENGIADEYKISIEDFIEDKRDVLFEDELWWLTGIKNMEWPESPQKREPSEIAREFHPRFVELAKEHIRTRRYSADARDLRNRVTASDSVWRELTGREPGLMMDIVAMNSLDIINRQAGKLTPVDILQMHLAVYDNVEHPFLREEVWRHYEEMMPQMSNKGVELPEGPAADILHGIIDRFRGKCVLVDFWGTGCGPCISAIMANREKRAQLEEKGNVALVFISTSSWSPEIGRYEDFVTENDMTNTFLISQDEWNMVTALLKINGLPHYVLFDEEGRIVDDYHNGSLNEFLKE